MNTLTSKQINDTLDKIQNILLTVEELCPSKNLNKYISQVLKDTDLNEVTEYLKVNLKHSFKLLNTKHSKFAILAIYSSCKNKDYKTLTRVLYVTGRIYYNMLLNKYIKHCNDIILSKAISNVKNTNIIKRYGPDEAVKKLANDISNKIKSNKTCEILYIIYRLYELRHRISQSIKSITRKYYQLYKLERSANNINLEIERITQDVITKITFYGNLKIPDKCSLYKELFKNIVNVDEELLHNSIYEIVSMLYISPSYQKIIANMDKLTHSPKVLKQLGIPVTKNSLYCYILTIYRTMTE